MQMQQMSKKNKVASPFYSPPSRLYGQTPAEIIKEARAAVMSPSAIGIKPVFTSRPFTPKEKERTLFGNVKKRSGRPPSSFSLRNLQNQEPGQRVKLPSIDIATRRKTLPSFHYSNNLSLDNLAEDYDAEILEEIGEINSEKLPKWKKSHSCPKEGRMVKAASYNELSFRKSEDDKNNSKELKKYETLKSLESKENNETNDEEDSDSTFVNVGDSVKGESSDMDSSISYRYKNMTRGAGDYENLEQHQINFINVCGKTPASTPREEGSLYSDYELGPPEEKIEDKKEAENKTAESEVEEKVESPKTKEPNENSEKSKEGKKVGSYRREESISTGFRSDYLTAMKEGRKSPYPPKQTEPVPLEILELYETARYYGVDMSDNDHAKDSSITSTTNNNNNQTSKNVDDYFGEKPNEYLNQLKENFTSLDEKLKTLNEKIKEKKEKTNEDVQYVMNNKKRYHIVKEKGENKEKAYKKWNSKQESVEESEEKTKEEGHDLFWKNSYYRSKEEDEQEEEKDQKKNEKSDLESMQRIINRINGFHKIGAESNDIYETNVQMYGLLKNTKAVLDGKMKAKILKALYLFADEENPEVLLSIARILLHLKVESSLPVAFKMVFKVARSDANDHLFLNEEDILELFLEGIGRSSPLDSAESCIYGYGALKFLTMNYNILSRILHLGALDLMTLHLKMINNAHMEKGKVGEQTQHALFQLTGALRHVAAGEGALPLFLTTNCITIICKTLHLFYKDDDVVTNISRTLSLLSADENVTQVLMSVENILTIIVELIERYKENDKILIRLSYCLGNIVEHSDLARVQLSRSDASLSVLLNSLKFYIDKDLEISMKEKSNQSPEELNAETVDDIIVKIIRIIANMSMNPIVGSNLSPTTNEKKSLQLSKLLSVLLLRKDPGITLLATLGCLNNISYYCNTHSVLIDITQGVERVLGLPSEDCQAEAARVLGNLTRHKEIRDLIYNTGGVNQLMKLLSSQDQEVVRCACGALVNMLLDAETRKHFVESHGIDRLVEALELFSNDWSLASLAARAIWNSCADDLSSAMSHNNMENLTTILANSLEEENWNDGDTAWEEFASIATDLLERINNHLEST